MPLQDAGQLLPATRPQADSFSFTEEDFPRRRRRCVTRQCYNGAARTGQGAD